MQRFVSYDMHGPERENPWIAKCHKAFTPVIDQGFLLTISIEFQIERL